MSIRIAAHIGAASFIRLIADELWSAFPLCTPTVYPSVTSRGQQKPCDVAVSDETMRVTGRGNAHIVFFVGIFSDVYSGGVWGVEELLR